MANFSVTQSTDNGQGNVAGSLSWAIKRANAIAGNDTITLETDVTLTGEMSQLIDSNVTIEGSGNSEDGDQEFNIDGNNAHRPLFIKSGTIAINNTDIVNGLAAGDAGEAEGGGGGAGLGGGLFIYSGNVTLSGVDIANNTAAGGTGGDIGGSTGGGGGFRPLFSGGRPGANSGFAHGDEINGGSGGFGSGGGAGGYSAGLVEDRDLTYVDYSGNTYYFDKYYGPG